MKGSLNHLGKRVSFSYGLEVVEGVIIGIMEDSVIVEETPAWLKTEKEYSYRVEVEYNDIGYVWVNHKKVTFKT